MRFTPILLGTLCLLCLFNPGNTELVAQQTTSIVIDLPGLENDPLLPGNKLLPLNWLPSGTNDDFLTFNINVTVPANFTNGGTLYASLQNVTAYSGKTGNGPPDTRPDLFMTSVRNRRNADWVGNNGNTLRRTLNSNSSETTATQTMSLRVDCRDSAAYGELELTASGSGYTSNTITVKIPRDTNGNKIADYWQNDAAVNEGRGYQRDADEDSGPNSRFGDNITVINEYRGFRVNGDLTRTDPTGWDVFVKIGPNLAGTYSIGGAYALPMTVHEAPWVNMVDGYVFPYEIAGGSSGTSPSVFAIRLQQDTAEVKRDENDNVIDDLLGSIYVGPPSSSSTATIYTNRVSYYMGDTFSDTISYIKMLSLPMR